MQSVELELHPAPFVTQPVINAAHYASVVKDILACEHSLFMQEPITPEVDSDQQGTLAVVIAEHVVYKPKYVEHPPLVHPVLPSQKHVDK